jgi:hypothetical protein
MLSAPIAARKRVPPADARNQVKSTMRILFSANGLPRFDGCSSVGGAAFGLTCGKLRCKGEKTVSASSFSKGARRPAIQAFAVEIHLLVA